LPPVAAVNASTTASKNLALTPRRGELSGSALRPVVGVDRFRVAVRPEMVGPLPFLDGRYP